MINNFGEVVSILLTADHTCRQSEDESKAYSYYTFDFLTKFLKHQ